MEAKLFARIIITSLISGVLANALSSGFEYELLIMFSCGFIAALYIFQP